IAASRPAPGPLTKTSSERIPFSSALRATISDVICAAYGVLLREPLKPFCPALDQHTTLPDGSVIVTIVLLNVLWICAWPRGTFFFSRRLPRWRFAAPAAPAFACCLAIVPPLQVTGHRSQVAVNAECNLRPVACDMGYFFAVFFLIPIAWP